MHMHGQSYRQQQISRARARGRRMANARWEQERRRLAALAEVESCDPLRAPGRIVRRIIVIDDGVTAREIIRYGYDSVRSWRRKLRSVGLSTSEREMPEH